MICGRIRCGVVAPELADRAITDPRDYLASAATACLG
jgi:hypothetical protein